MAKFLFSKKKLLLILQFVVFSTCIAVSQDTSSFTIYNESFKLPGEWVLKETKTEDTLYSLEKKNSNVSLLILIRKIESFSYYDYNLTNMEFLEEYFERTVKSWKKRGHKVDAEKIVIDEENSLLIWQINTNNQKFPNFRISGVRNRKLITLTLSDRNIEQPMSKEQKIEFLKNRYLNN